MNFVLVSLAEKEIIPPSRKTSIASATDKFEQPENYKIKLTIGWCIINSIFNQAFKVITKEISTMCLLCKRIYKLISAI